MKTSVVLFDGIKQVNLTPENESERMALKMITPDDSIELAVVKGSFGCLDRRFAVAETRGGYLRMFEDTETVMLVLRPKRKSEPDDKCDC